MRIIGDGGHAKVIREFAPWWRRGFVIAIGDNKDRWRVAQAFNGYCPALIHPSAAVSRSALIGRGAVVMAGAIVGPGTSIGPFAIINHNAVVDHNCVVMDYAHIAPGATLCGDVWVYQGALVGVGVGIAPGAKIPAWSICKARRLEIETLPSHC